MVWRKFGRREALFSYLGPAFFYLATAFGIGYFFWPYFYLIKNEHLLTVGIFCIWRYGWIFIHYLRSLLYYIFIYPSIRKRVDRQWEEAPALRPDRLFFLIPSYREELWITYEMVKGLFSELTTVPCKATIVIATGSDLEDKLITDLHDSHPIAKDVELILQRQSSGKRIAMGDALRAIARRYFSATEPDDNSITIFMDGDSVIAPGTLKKLLPFFASLPKLGAVTTNEVAYINSKSKWYRDWFNMKFGQRHLMFGSHSVSRRVLTLTGRFSVFRTSIVIQDEFIRRVESDHLEHPLLGRFRFLMGDDKSTWFELLRQRWDMLYLPDCLVYSLESRKAGMRDSIDLFLRWHGNTLRNNRRALSLGPAGVGGLFIWLCILDQKLSMWTALVGISSALALSIAIHPVYFSIFIAWILIVRTVQMGFIAMTGHPVSFRTVPLMIYNQWVGALVKIWTNFNLANQRWKKGAATQQASEGWIKIRHPMAVMMPYFKMALSCISFIMAILLTEGILDLPNLYALIPPAKQPLEINALSLGVVPNDGEDDTFELNQAIASAPDGAIIRLPAGVIDIAEPIIVKRSNIKIVGSGRKRTILEGHGLASGRAMIEIRGKARKLSIMLAPGNHRNATILKLASNAGELTPPFQSGDLILLRRPNDSAFLTNIGSQCWNREYPYIRQEIFKIYKVEGHDLFLDRPLFFEYPPEVTEVWKISPIRNVHLEGFTLSYRVLGGAPSPSPESYENSYPEEMVDLLLAEYASDIVLDSLSFLNAGRHPVNLDKVYGIRGERLYMDGAWNKGKGGAGYFRMARTYSSAFYDIHVVNLRHIGIQWSSAYNIITGLSSGVDVNFHGGFPHHNAVWNARFQIPPSHPWPPVVSIDGSACFAPPNGPGNFVNGKEY